MGSHPPKGGTPDDLIQYLLMQFINSFLNKITMYRLMTYFLLFLVGWAALLSFLHVLSFSGIDILSEGVYLTAICWVSNKLFAKIFKVSPNTESFLITALILTLIIGPISPITQVMSGGLLYLSLAAVLAMASKYLVAYKKKHIFNPAAFGALVGGLLIGQGPSWWVGGVWFAPVLLLGGFLILKKIRRFKMVGVYILAIVLGSMVVSLVTAGTLSLNIGELVSFIILSSILFFSFVMLPEPLTSPYQAKFLIIYAILVAALFYATAAAPFNLPDPLALSLLIGNIFSYAVSGSFRAVLKLKEKKELTKDVVAFKFESWGGQTFKAGQYFEWTLAHPNPDSRGVRRYFTIASSPSEDFIMLVSKFYEMPSTYKQALHKMEPGQNIVISQLQGEFTLPDDKNKKLVFIAGGIGITPFRSMVKYLIDKDEKRDMVLLYSNKTQADIVFKDILDEGKKVGLRTVYVNTDKDGFIDEKLIRKEVPDFASRMFYVSGPEPMVEAFGKMLRGMGLDKTNIKRDFFPGYTEER